MTPMADDFMPLLDTVARLPKPLIISSGLADLELLDRTVAFVEAARGSRDGLALLHCVSSYPAPDEDANLRAIGLLAERYPGWTIGYSDHTLGLDASVWRVLDKAHNQRNLAEYQGVLDLTEQLVADIANAATQVRSKVAALGPVRTT